MDLDDPHATHPMQRLDLSSVTAGLILVGRYRLDALLAHSRGVMSWRATDQVLSRPVLVHLLEPDDARIGWVLQAARDAATVNDSRFLRVLDALEASGQEPWSFVICEFAVGDSLQSLLADGPLSGQEAGYIVHEVAAALAPRHARGMFHQRIGPDTVVITPNGNVKISGFLVDSALRPEPGQDALSWTELEAIDTSALGSLLYAATTARWPVPPSEPQRPHWGLAPAPLRAQPTGTTANESAWPAPSELNRAIDPRLSAITMAILRPALGLVGPSLRTVDEVVDSLDEVVEMAGAEESLENLVRRRRGLAATPATPALLDATHGWSWPTPAADPPTLQMEAIGPAEQARPPEQARAPEGAGGRGSRPADSPSGPVVPVQARPAQPSPDQTQTAPRPAVVNPAVVNTYVPIDRDRPISPDRPVGPERPRPVPAPPRARPTRSGALGLRWVLLLVGFVVVALVVLQVRGCSNQGNQANPPGTEHTSAAAAEPVSIVAAFDFDPVADGGDQNENSDQAHFAADGDPSTVWHTLTYINNPAFGGLKPGAGIVFDLGREVVVDSVSLILDNQPNALQLMVPIEADPAASKPPMESVRQWQVIASDPAAGLQVTLRPDEPVTTRWVMVYFTSLPPVGPSLYRSGIAETYINR